MIRRPDARTLAQRHRETVAGMLQGFELEADRTSGKARRDDIRQTYIEDVNRYRQRRAA